MRARKFSEINFLPTGAVRLSAGGYEGEAGQKNCRIADSPCRSRLRDTPAASRSPGVVAKQCMGRHQWRPQSVWPFSGYHQTHSRFTHPANGARRVIEEYICEKLRGGYGHSQRGLKLFRKRLGYPTSKTGAAAPRAATSTANNRYALPTVRWWQR